MTIHHQILDSLSSNYNIRFNIIELGDPFKKLNDTKGSFDTKKYEDYEMIKYIQIYPENEPIYNIIRLNKILDTLVPTLEPDEKNYAEITKINRLLRKPEKRLKLGNLIFKREYNIPIIDNSTKDEVHYPFKMCCIIDLYPDLNYYSNYEYRQFQHKSLDLDKPTEISNINNLK